MVSVSCIELSSCETDVCLFFVSGCDCGLVHDFTHQAFSVKRAVVFFPTATRVPFVFLSLRCFCYLQDDFVVAIYYLLDVGHAAVAELYGVPVGKFPRFVARWERSFNEADERTSDVDLTLLLYGGLNHITFLCRLRFCDGGCCGGGLNSSLKA